MRIALCVLLLILLSGCTSISPQFTQASVVLVDDKYLHFEKIKIESPDEIFFLADDAKGFAKQSVKNIPNPQEQIKSMVRAIFDHSDFNLLYRADANTVAQTTFENRAANCLSLSIMTYALARHLGFGARFQHVEIPEYWTRREGQRILNSHINLQIVPKQNRAYVELTRQGFEVDFDAQATRKHDKRSLLSESQVIALFYNNKGSDALLRRDDLRAYAYFRASYLADPRQAHLLANLGYLYRLNGHYAKAEKAYQLALHIDTNNLTVWQNLALLYKHVQQEEKAAEILTRLERKRANNPFYHLSLGETAFEKHNWDSALDHYRKALSLDKTLHEVFFGLAKTYYELGKLKRSEHFLQLAYQKSRYQEEANVYAAKIEFLRRQMLSATTS